MKKVALTFVALLMAVLPAFAENVTVQTAQRVAQSFLNSKMEVVPQIHLIDFAEKASFPNFYVFGNERCFVIIAGDDAVHPVLGYSTNGGFGNEEMCNEVRDWLKSYDDQIALVKTDRLAATEEILSEWNDLMNGRGLKLKSRTMVSPLIRTKWNHKLVPFNNLCPEVPNRPGSHCVGGCGSVAMAQFLKYWEHPIKGIGEHSYTPHAHPEFGVQYANFGETVYDWDNMLNDYFHGYSDAEASAVATLLYHCGVSVDINYGDTASGTNPPDVDTALWTYFNYTHNSHYLRKINYTDAQWIAMLKSDLDLERPVIYRGKNQQTDVGHIFICDGYDEYDYFHFVLGWGGNYDGYYAIGSIHPSYDMNYLNGAIFGSYPNIPSIAPPNNISTSVSRQNVIINWSPVSGASHYRLYRDGDLVSAHLNNSSYTDHDVNYGTHFYYVKSVKNDGTMSLKSSKAFAEIHFSGPTPTNMQANTNGYNVNLSWQTPNTESSILHHGLGEPSTSGAGTNTQGDRTYWAHRYSASVLMADAGMAIEKVSFYSRRAGEYTVGIYKGDVATITEFVYQQNYTATAGSWQDIVFTQPVPIDYTQDLWVVFYSDVFKPASYCSYSDANVADASLYSQSGVSSWSRLNDRSWLMKTYLTDGTYTYNLYRNGNAVATDLSGNTYTDTNLPDGIYDYHVTTNYFGGESDPSNTAHVQVGDPTYAIINGYGTSDGGYYLIASPFDGIAADGITGMTDGDYDLYRFDQSQEREWRNYKADAFALMAGKGYLYAHKTDVALRITGTQPYDGNGTIALEYVEGHPLTGWNLVGNPYLYDVTSCATEHVAYGCYRMNETKDDLVVSEISEAHPLKPLEACFVRTTAENATITFNPHRSVTTGRCESIRIEVAEKGRLADRLMVVRGGANALQKLSLKEKRTKIFATDGQEELSIVPCEGAEQPFCFQAGEEGTYTLTVTLEGMKADYLHLVDAQTGADVDLLETRSYRFEATPTDDPCRFKLIIKTKQSANRSND